jgi:hypothetical protein
MIAQLVSRRTLVASPSAGVGVMGGTYYTRREGRDVLSMYNLLSRSDTADVAYVQRSQDNGETWDTPETWPCKFDAPNGTGRRHPRGGYVDPATGRYFTVWTEGVLPTDHPLEGMRQWTLWYTVSNDGGITDLVREQIMHEGEGYDPVHHLPGVTVGRNCVMMGDRGQLPLTRGDGAILLPVQVTPTGPDGDYHNPGKGLTYTDCMLLIGRWRRDGGLAWTTSSRIEGDPGRTTRGLIEPTIAELDDGRILMIMRGSNDACPQWPGYRWACLSGDGGQTWSAAEPWMHDDGTPMHSPSSCSQLLKHSSGRLFWMGNRCEHNPSGNAPRYPIILCEVDRRSGRALRDTITVIDDRQSGEHERLTLSNFHAREDRETGDILLHMPRFFAHAELTGPANFTSDLFQYRIRLTCG